MRKAAARIGKLESFKLPPAMVHPVDKARRAIAWIAENFDRPFFDLGETLGMASGRIRFTLSPHVGGMSPIPQSPRPGDDRLGDYPELSRDERALVRRLETIARGKDLDGGYGALSALRKERGLPGWGEVETTDA